MVSTTLIVSTFLAGVVVAQQTGAPNASYPAQDVQSVIDAIDQTTRNSWCTAQRSSCGTLCGGLTNAGTNKCDGGTLNFTCTCSSNNSAPALQFYADTIPTFECTTLNGACMSNNANDLSGQQECNVTYPCGPQVPVSAAAAAASSAAASTSAASSSAAQTSSASATGSAATASATGAATALRIGEQYGVGILGAGLLAIMGLAL